MSELNLLNKDESDSILEKLEKNPNFKVTDYSYEDRLNLIFLIKDRREIDHVELSTSSFVFRLTLHCSNNISYNLFFSLEEKEKLKEEDLGEDIEI